MGANLKRNAKPGSICSTTVYGFDLDKRELEIQDHDLFIPATAILFSTGLKLKTVSSNISDIMTASIRLAKPPFTSMESVLNKSKVIDKNTALVERASNIFTLRIRQPFTVSQESAALLHLRYKVKLEGTGPKLQYGAAVQPSDYVEIREHLKIENVFKTIKVSVLSCRPFEAWIFNASVPIAFPASTPSILDRVQCFSSEFNMDMALEEWERAKYFTLFVQ